MLKAISLIVIFISFQVMADCSVFITKSGTTDKQDRILKEKLEKKGYQIVEEKDKAEYLFDISSGPRNRYESMWFAFAVLKKNDASDKQQFFTGGDYAVMLPLHMLTFTISTFIPTKGSIAMKTLMHKVPQCEEVPNALAKKLEAQEEISLEENAELEN